MKASENLQKTLDLTEKLETAVQEEFGLQFKLVSADFDRKELILSEVVKVLRGPLRIILKNFYRVPFIETATGELSFLSGLESIESENSCFSLWGTTLEAVYPPAFPAAIKNSLSQPSIIVFLVEGDIFEEKKAFSVRKSGAEKGLYFLITESRPQAVVFRSSQWTLNQVKLWITEHLPALTSLRWNSLADVPPALRRLFNFRYELVREWVDEYLKGLVLGEQKPRQYAWDLFLARWERNNGRWIERTGNASNQLSRAD